MYRRHTMLTLSPPTTIDLETGKQIFSDEYEMLNAFKRELGDRLSELAEFMKDWGQQFSDLKGKNKKAYRSISRVEKGVELCRTLYDCEIEIPKKPKNLFESAGLLGIQILLKLPQIYLNGQVEKLDALAQEYELKSSHISKAASQNPVEWEDGQLVAWPGAGGETIEGWVSGGENGIVKVEGFNGEKDSFEEGITCPLKKFAEPNVGDVITIKDRSSPHYNMQGVILSGDRQEQQVYILQVGSNVCVPVELRWLRKATAKEIGLQLVMKIQEIAASSGEVESAALHDLLDKLEAAKIQKEK